MTEFLTTPPEDISVEKKTKHITLLVDSRDRDRRKYPEDNKYTFQLKESLYDVLSIELFDGVLPTPSILYHGNNMIYLDNTPLDQSTKNTTPNAIDSLQKVPISPIYLPNPDPVRLATYLSTTLSNTLNQTITIKYHPETKTFSLQSDLSNNTPFCPVWHGGEVAFGEQEIDRIVVRNDDDTEYRDQDGQLVYKEIDISPQKDIYLPGSIGSLLGFKAETTVGFWWGSLDYLEDDCWMATPNLTSNDRFPLVKNQWILIKNYTDSSGPTGNNTNDYIRVQIISVEPLSDGSTKITLQPNETYSTFRTLLRSNDTSIDTPILFHSGCYSSNTQASLMEQYIVMNISSIHRNHSNNTAIHKSFAIIPNISKNTQDDNLTTNQIQVRGDLGYKKRFSHPRTRISELNISFCYPDGSGVNFGCDNHYLVFNVEVSGQSLKYFTATS